MFAVAAEQYLPVIDAVDEPTERSQVVGLLRHAADQASGIGDYALMGTLLAAALSRVDPSETDTLLELRTARHAALYGMGRLDEADEEYRAIEAAAQESYSSGCIVGASRRCAARKSSMMRAQSCCVMSRTPVIRANTRGPTS